MIRLSLHFVQLVEKNLDSKSRGYLPPIVPSSCTLLEYHYHLGHSQVKYSWRNHLQTGKLNVNWLPNVFAISIATLLVGKWKTPMRFDFKKPIMRSSNNITFKASGFCTIAISMCRRVTGCKFKSFKQVMSRSFETSPLKQIV